MTCLHMPAHALLYLLRGVQMQSEKQLRRRSPTAVTAGDTTGRIICKMPTRLVLALALIRAQVQFLG